MRQSKPMSVFLPVRKGSQRVRNKNTRVFAHHLGGLLELKLMQLLEVKGVGEIVLSSNDDACLDVAYEFSKKYGHLKIVRRPDNLGSSETNLIDLVQYAATICQYENILWTHVTSPFFDADNYDEAILQYYEAKNTGYDSLMSVKCYKNFLWSKNKNDIVNRVTAEKWPQTQELEELYEIDNAVFITSKSIYSEQVDRIGIKPKLLVQNGIKTLDVDWEDDFLLAEMIYKNL